MNDEKPNAVELARQHVHPDYDEIAKRGLGTLPHDLSRVTEAFDESKGKTQGGESGHTGHAGAWMSQKDLRALVSRFVTAGQDRAYVIRCLQNSGYSVEGL